MKSPKKLEPMKQDMGEPLHKIQDNKKDEQLRPHGPSRRVNKCYAFSGNANIVKKHPQQLIEAANCDREQKEVEEHIESVQPKIFSENRLFFSPRKNHFQAPNKKRDGDKPPKVIGIPWHIEQNGLPGPVYRSHKRVCKCV